MSDLRSNAITALDDSTIQLTTNDASNKTLTITATNSGAGSGTVNITGDSINIEDIKFIDNQIEATGVGDDVDIDFQTKGTGTYNFNGTSDQASTISLFENSDNGSNNVSLKAPETISSSYSLTLPSTTGTENQVISIDGSSNLQWSNFTELSTIVITADPSPSAVGNRYLANSTGGAFNLTLPDTSGLTVGNNIEIVDSHGQFGSNPITLVASGSDQIYFPNQNDGYTSLVLQESNIYRNIVYASTNRWIISRGQSNAITAQYAVLTQQSATTGGSATANTWITRPLNTESDPNSIVSLSSNQFTLQSGSYYIEGFATSFKNDEFQTRIRNITDGTTVILGTSSFASSVYNTVAVSSVKGLLSIDSAKTYELQVYNMVEGDSNSMGIDTDSGEDNIHAQIIVQKYISLIANSADNRITTTTAEGTLNAEENLTFDGSIITLTGDLSISGTIEDTNNNEYLTFSETSSAVNQFTITNNSTGNNPIFSSTGDDTNIGMDFQTKGTGSYHFKSTSSQATNLVLYEDTDDGSNTISITVPTLSSSYSLTLPIDDGTDGQVLSTDGSGVLTWEDNTGGGGASALGDLTDVTITSADTNDILTYSGGAWVDSNSITLGGTLSVTGTSTFNGDISLQDDDNLLIGTGNDLTIVHNGTNTSITSTTGDLIIDNTNITGSTVVQLGTDTSATDFQIQNNSGNALMTIDGSGATSFTGNVSLNDNDNLYVGTGNDLTLIHDGTDTTITSTTGNLIVDNTNITGSTVFILGTDDTDTDFQIQNNSGTSLLTVNSSGVNLASGDTYQITGTTVLTNNTLGSGIVTSSLTTVGALDSGSITSGFSSIDVGSSSISGGTITGTSLVLTGDLNLTNQATDIDLIDNNSSALSFDANGKPGILNIITTNDSEGVSMSGTLDVVGDISINSNTIFSESGGTVTLSNIDAIDTTTETTLESAIDSLSNLTTVGTITSGTWNGTAIGVQYGGTGQTTLTSNSLLTGNGTSGITSESNLTFDGSALTLTGDFSISSNIIDTNGNEYLIFSETASAVNEFTITNNATGSNPIFSVSGDDANIGIDFQTKGTGSYHFKSTSSQASTLVLYEDTDDGSNTVSITVPTLGSSYSLTLPIDDGDDGEVLTTNGSGVLSWGSAGGGSLNELSDVTITSADTNDILTYSGGAWVDSNSLTLGGTFTANGQSLFNSSIFINDSTIMYFGDGSDLRIVHNGTNSIIQSLTGNLVFDNTNTTGSTILQLGTDDTNTNVQILNNSGSTLITLDSSGIDIASGDTYQINGTTVLSNDTLGSSVLTSSLTTVGTLDSGSISSGFGNIDIGSSTITGGSINGSSLTLTGDINLTGQATDIDLVDNNSSALSFDSAGKAGILNIITTDSSEGVSMSGTLDVVGDISINSNTIFSESGGTVTLSNVDAIDATTESTLESAIDSLSNLTTVGTITTGTWNGTAIGVQYGGTGQTTLTSNSLLTGNGTSGITSESNLTFDGSTLTLTGDFSISSNILDTNGNEYIVFSETASAVNEFTITNNATGSNPIFSATGSDSDIGIDFQTKGTGSYHFKSTSSQASTLVLYEDTDDGSNTVSITVPTLSSSYSLTLPIDDGNSGEVLTTNGSGALSWGSASGNIFAQYAILSEESADAGGAISGTGWTTRVISDESDPSGIVTLSSNQFTLEAGKYYLEGMTVAYKTGYHQARIANITDTSYIYGTSTVANKLYAQTNSSIVKGVIDIDSSKTFELQHYNESTESDGNETGVDTGDSTNANVHAFVAIIKYNSTGTVEAGTWNGDTITVAYGGTGQTSLTSNAVLTGNGTSGITSESNLTFDGSVLTVSGDVSLGDNNTLTIGTGDDLSVSHDGTDTLITSTTGDLTIDNTNATGSTIVQLGTDTTATDFQIQNNTGTALLTVDGAGNVVSNSTFIESYTAIDDGDSPYTALSTDGIIGCNSTNGAITVNLPAVSGLTVGRKYTIVDIGGNSSSNNITIDGNGSETINGETTTLISSDYTSITLFTNGTSWFII